MSNIKRSIAKLSFVRKMVTKNGSIVNDIDKCILCGKCEKACPLGSITIDKTAKKWSIDNSVCMRCGACIKACPVDALSLQK